VRRLAALLLAAALHALALPAAVAAPASDGTEHCGDCHTLPGDPCLMAPAGTVAVDETGAVARDRFRPPSPAVMPVAVLPPVVAADLTAPPPAPLLASGAARSGRHTGDPPRHLRLGRLRN
jgi:hypothetical protein